VHHIQIMAKQLMLPVRQLLKHTILHLVMFVFL